MPRQSPIAFDDVKNAGFFLRFSGGSPPPQIKWYKLGHSQMLDATIMRGENKDEPTRSILNVVPTKNDDGASYRCTVWNRALRQEHSLEAGTKIYVNCKYIKIGTTAGSGCFT